MREEDIVCVGSDGLQYCKVCGEAKEAFFPKGDLFVITYKTAKTLDFTGIPAHSSNKLSAHLLSDHI